MTPVLNYFRDQKKNDTCLMMIIILTWIEWDNDYFYLFTILIPFWIDWNSHHDNDDNDNGNFIFYFGLVFFYISLFFSPNLSSILFFDFVFFRQIWIQGWSIFFLECDKISNRTENLFYFFFCCRSKSQKSLIF